MEVGTEQAGGPTGGSALSCCGTEMCFHGLGNVLPLGTEINTFSTCKQH